MVTHLSLYKRMELVVLPPKEPTHRVTHEPSQLDAPIYIAQSLQEKLASPNPTIQQNAESAVAISFREACRKRGGVIPARYVKYGDLQLNEIDRTAEEPFIALTHGGEPVDYDD